ncbi:MAG: pyridoxal-phosphate dependent enzyme [bacterium]|nr:pyridoxal-phosphate dependent enzyme [bacterium]
MEGASDIPVGGGGLLAGVGTALRLARPGVRIVAVEPEGCPALDASLRQGAPASVECSTLCDGVAVPYMTEEMFPILAELVDEVRLISEDDVRSTIRRLALENHVVVEGAGALATAAAAAEPASTQGPSVALLSGGSIDAEVLAGIVGGA